MSDLFCRCSHETTHLVAICCGDVVVLRSQVGSSNNEVHVEVTVIVLWGETVQLSKSTERHENKNVFL